MSRMMWWLLLLVAGCTELDREMLDHSRKLREEWTKRGVPPGRQNPVPIPFTPSSELDGLKVLNTWPKRCSACGHEYTAEEWQRLPAPANGISCTEDAYAKWAWRNCDQPVSDGAGGTKPCRGTMQAITFIKDESQE